MADVDKLIKSRAGYRANLTAVLNSIDQILSKFVETKLAELRGLRSVLNERFLKLQEIDDLIYQRFVDDPGTTQEKLETEACAASEIAIRVQTTLFRMQELLDRREVVVSANDVAISASDRAGQARAKLPKISLEKFTGNPELWYAFWDSFSSLIDDNADLNEIDKFNYLRSFLGGEALSSISGLSLTRENYGSAVSLLKDRFGKKVFVISSHMDSLMKLMQGSPMDSTRKLRRVYD